jgi:hypothetical protein
MDLALNESCLGYGAGVPVDAQDGHRPRGRDAIEVSFDPPESF